MKKVSNKQKSFIVSLKNIFMILLGVFYVVPLYYFIGNSGGAMYGYFYVFYLALYMIFFCISIGFSKMILLEHFEEQYNRKNKIFSVFRKLSICLGILLSIFTFLFSPKLSSFIVSSAYSNKVITNLFRIFSINLLFIPLISIYNGYFLGSHFNRASKMIKFIEMASRGLFILIFEWFVSIFFKNSSIKIYIPVIGISFGVILSYICLRLIYSSNKRELAKTNKRVVERPIKIKDLFTKFKSSVSIYVISGILLSIYFISDLFTIPHVLINNFDFDITLVEEVMSAIFVWSFPIIYMFCGILRYFIYKFRFIVEKGFNKNNILELTSCIVNSSNFILFITIPISILISFLGNTLWKSFYNCLSVGLGLFVFTLLFGIILCWFLLFLFSLKEYKEIIISLISGVFVKVLFNVSLVRSISYFGLKPYYGFFIATILGLLLSIIIILCILGLKYKIMFEKFVKSVVDIISGSLVMIVSLFLFKLFIPVSCSSIFLNILIILFYTLVGFVIYFYYSKFVGLLENIRFGTKYLYVNYIKKN